MHKTMEQVQQDGTSTTVKDILLAKCAKSNNGKAAQCKAKMCYLWMAPYMYTLRWEDPIKHFYLQNELIKMVDKYE